VHQGHHREQHRDCGQASEAVVLLDGFEQVCGLLKGFAPSYLRLLREFFLSSIALAKLAESSPSFDFLADLREDIYTLEDGEPV